MKNIRTKGNKFNRIDNDIDIPVFPVEIRYTEPKAIPMSKTLKPSIKKIKPKTKSGNKSKSGFHWDEDNNCWINIKDIT